MDVIAGSHVFFAAVGLGGVASMYASTEEKCRNSSERVAWLGLLGVLATGPVYAFNWGITDLVASKIGLSVLLLFGMLWLRRRLEDMERARGSTMLLVLFLFWTVVFLLGVQGTHP